MAAESVLLVEGKDDFHVVRNLLACHDLEHAFSIEPKSEDWGFSRLLESVPVRLKQSELKRLGIIVDADADPAARWQSIRDTIVRSGYVAPAAIAESGFVFTPEDLPAVGVWMMPSNAAAGAIEDFVCSLIPPTDALLVRARTCVDDIPDAERRFARQHHSKAVVHTWLAWQKEPGKPMGAGFARRYLDPECPPAMGFIGWVRALLVAGPAEGLA